MQLDLPLTHGIEKPTRKATYIEHRKLIFEHLNFSYFDENALELLRKWSGEKVSQGTLLADHLLPQAEQFLISNRIALPSIKQLKRFVNSLCSQYQEAIYERIYTRLSVDLIITIDQILTVDENEKDSWFNQLKEYPEATTISSLKRYLAKYHRLCNVNLQGIEIEELNSEFISYLYQLGRYYSADKIKRLKTFKRYTLMAAFLSESRKILLDYILQMHDQYISNVIRECKNMNEEQIRQYRYKHDKAIDKFISVIDQILVKESDESIALEELYKSTVPQEALKEARKDINTYRLITRYGFANLLQNRYSSMRRYFSEFIKLPFHSETENSSLMQAIQLICQLDDDTLKTLPNESPYEFIDHKIRKAIFNTDGSIKRNLWEMGVAIALRDATRSSDIYVPQSKKYVSFWDLVYKKEVWEEARSQVYTDLSLTENPKQAIYNLVDFYHQSISSSQRRFGDDGFAIIKNGNLKLSKPDKLIIPEEVKELQKKIVSFLPKIKIERLLIEVDQLTGFSRHFLPIHGQSSKPEKFYKTLMASILSQATNIGIATMQNCTTDITVEMMRHISDTYVRENTIKNANAEIVNQHACLPLSLIHGRGDISSSDAQRFAVTASSLISSYYPRYYGYYEKAVGIYTHVSNQYSVYNTKVISCSPREALYVLDGLLENNTILKIKEHTTDTAGYTEHIFALCYLLGYQFMPRIRDLKDQQLYKPDKNISYGELDSILNKYIDLELIEAQWDQMMRVIGSLKNKLAPAHEIVRRLGKGTPSDRLSKAFTQLGRLIKTEYILRYITSPELRQKVQRQLNKGEHRHSLSRWIFFANQGKFQIGDYEEIMNKASCLSLVSNAILYWNTTKMQGVISQLEKNGDKIEKSWLPHISLLSHKHVIPMGTYFVEPEYEKEPLILQKGTVSF